MKNSNLKRKLTAWLRITSETSLWLFGPKALQQQAHWHICYYRLNIKTGAVDSLLFTKGLPFYIFIAKQRFKKKKKLILTHANNLSYCFLFIERQSAKITLLASDTRLRLLYLNRDLLIKNYWFVLQHHLQIHIDKFILTACMFFN